MKTRRGWLTGMLLIAATVAAAPIVARSNSAVQSSDGPWECTLTYTFGQTSADGSVKILHQEVLQQFVTDELPEVTVTVLPE